MPRQSGARAPGRLFVSRLGVRFPRHHGESRTVRTIGVFESEVKLFEPRRPEAPENVLLGQNIVGGIIYGGRSNRRAPRGQVPGVEERRVPAHATGGNAGPLEVFTRQVGLVESG